MRFAGSRSTARAGCEARGRDHRAIRRDLRLAVLYYEEWLLVAGDTPERAAVEARLDCLRERRATTPLAKAPVMIVDSPGLAAGGYVLSALGVGSFIGGSIAATQPSHGRYDFTGLVIGAPLFVHGLICLATGIPMIVVGHRKISPVLTPIVLQPLRTGEIHGPRAPVGLAITGHVLSSLTSSRRAPVILDTVGVAHGSA